MEYGYVRVSAIDQNIARQMLEMKSLNIHKKEYMLISNQAKILIALAIRIY